MVWARHSLKYLTVDNALSRADFSTGKALFWNASPLGRCADPGVARLTPGPVAQLTRQHPTGSNSHSRAA
ncbi:MAG: hypothetical protein H5T63_06470 [Chloroflexi bacterium]|nr:hypothetical protein [Chloroflexota bacterium]